MNTQKITLLIADDHGILRQGLRRILDNEPDMRVVGEAATGDDAVKRAKQLNPDVVIMDVSMPGQNGIESLRQIVEAQTARVVVLSVHVEHHFISEAMSAGAVGYLAKESLDHELIAAIRSVVRGGTVLSSSVTKALVHHTKNPGDIRSLSALSVREREVFMLLAEGKTPTEIGTQLFVSPKTVHTHRQHILEKLGLESTTDLIRYALREGIIRSV